MKNHGWKLSALGWMMFAGLVANPVMNVARADVPALKKIVWVWLENTSYKEMNLQPYAKYLWLKVGAGRFATFSPISPVTQANTVAMISGSDYGIQDNDLTRLFTPSVLDLLESHNIQWKVYAEDYPGACYLAAGTTDYRRYRVPFLSLSSVQSDAFRCSKVMGFSNMSDDIQRGLLPQFAVVVPSLKGSGATSSAQVADQTLKKVLDPIIKSPETFAETTIIISTTTMADPTKPAFMMILGNGVNINGTTVVDKMNHYNVLKTIEAGLKLGNLNQSDVAAAPITQIWK